MLLVLGLCLWDQFIPALIISFLMLVLFLGTIFWLYARYQTLPAVREKSNLTRLVLKFEKKLQADDLRIYQAVKERTNLVQAERREIHTGLSALRKNYIETGLGHATIKQALIPGVGPKLKELLADRGILTAAQLNETIAQLPGFGEAKCQAVLAWRKSVVANLESTKPTALPPEQLERIQQKYQALHDENNAAERKAIASQQILEHELMSLKPHLRSLAPITFAGYLRRSLASHAVVAALVACVLVLTQVVSSVSATMGFGASNAAALMASIPMQTATSSVMPADPTIAFTATVTKTTTLTFTPTSTLTNTPAATVTPLPTFTLRPINTPTIAIPVSGGIDTGNCDPSYPTVCIPPPPPDLDCGDIPYDNFTVLPPDPHNFDREGDGLGCE